jgi:peroxiredoxin Q/BCP
MSSVKKTTKKTTVKKIATTKTPVSKTTTKKAPEKTTFPAKGTTAVTGPAVGAKAPAISAVDEAGKPFRLSSLAGKKVVLYFYPKAMTSGCTRESEAFRDQAAAFGRAGAVIVGASPDASAAQLKFKEKYGLPFTLIADTDHAVATAYGVWKEKSLYGRKFMGIERTTFLIDAKGVVQKVWTKVKVDGHVDAVLAAVKAT